MDDITLKWLKERLLFLKKEIELRIKENSDKANIKEHGDIGDYSHAIYTKDIIYDLLEKDRKHLQEVNESLYRIGNGSYGKCARCGKEIEVERMKAKPTAQYCIECRKIVESGR